TQRLPRKGGQGRAREWIIAGRTGPAKEAEQLGLVNRVVPRENLGKTVDEVARQLASGPTKTLGMDKRLVARAAVVDLTEALEYEALHQDIAGKTTDHLEAVKAFLEKRQPRFTGH